NLLYTRHVEVAGRDALHIAAIARDGPNMSPAIAFTGPEKSFAAIDRPHIAACQSGLVPVDVPPGNVDPGVVLFSEQRTHLSRLNITEHDEICVLQAVELF